MVQLPTVALDLVALTNQLAVPNLLSFLAMVTLDLPPPPCGLPISCMQSKPKKVHIDIKYNDILIHVQF